MTPGSELGGVLDEAAPLLGGSGQEAGRVDEGADRQVEGVAEAHEAGSLDRGASVEHPGQHRRLVGHDADRPAVHPSEADHQVGRE